LNVDFTDQFTVACVRVRVPQSSDSVKFFRKFFRKCSKIRENGSIINIIRIMRIRLFCVAAFDPPPFSSKSVQKPMTSKHTHAPKWRKT